ncbi:MAG: LysM peptidoglycan-binding domain-containing protein [Pseudomonadota bacterium]
MCRVRNWLSPRGFVGGIAFGALLASLPLGASSTDAAECGGSYSVESGDTLGRIAQLCGTGIDAILQANADLSDPSALKVGQRLVMPGRGAAGTASGERRRMTGRIVNGRNCAQLRTADGKVYGLVSPKMPFVTGKTVVVTGSMHAYDGCRPDLTMLVKTMEDAGS